MPRRKRKSSASAPWCIRLKRVEEFSGDWAKKEKKFTVENGWIHWYVDHYDLKVIKVNLIQCVNGNFKLYPFLKIS